MFTLAIVGGLVVAASAVLTWRQVTTDGYGNPMTGPRTWPTEPSDTLPWQSYVR